MSEITEPVPNGNSASLVVGVVKHELQQVERDIIDRQLHFSQDDETHLLSLLRYASKGDLLVAGISTVFALAAGAIIPVPPVVFGRLSSVLAGVDNDGSTADAQASRVLITQYSLYFIYLAVASFFAWFISTAGFSHVGSNVTRRVKVRFMDAALRQNMAVFDDVGTGHLVTQLSVDMNLIQEALSQKLSVTLSAVGTLVGTYVVSLVMFWKLALILTWSFFLALALLYVGKLVSSRFSRRSSEAQSAGSTLAEEALTSIRSTTALGLQKQILDAYVECLDVARQADLTLKTLMGVLLAVVVATGYFNVALAFWQGARFMVDAETSFMAVVAITLVTKSAAFCVLGVAQNAEKFTSAMAAARRVCKILNRKSPIDSLGDQGAKPDDMGVEGNVEFRNVKHVYPSRPEVVVAHDLNIMFPSGKTTAVVGSSGSGKSSIAKLILRFYEPVAGEILLDGTPVESLNVRWLRSRIRLVSQEPVLFDASIYENISQGFVGTRLHHLSADEQRRRVEDAAASAGAHDFIQALPAGYATRVGAGGSKLSGGQKQRVAIARALVADPKVLILDEATSALDAETEASVQRALAVSSDTRTTIVIAHRLSTIREADKIVVLKSGAVAEEGTDSELMSIRGAYFHLVEAQRLSGGSESAQEAELEHDASSVMDEPPSEKDESAEAKETFDASSPSPCPDSGAEKTSAPYSLWSVAKFVMQLNAKERKYIVVGLVFSIMAGLEEPASAVLFGKAVVAIARPLNADTAPQMLSDSAFWACMFFVLALVMMMAFSIQGSVFAYCSEHLIHRARSLALAHVLRQEMAFFDDAAHSGPALASFLSTEAADLAGISGGTLGLILIAVATLVSSLAVGLAFGWKLALVCWSITPVLIGSGFAGVWAVGEFERRNEVHTRASAAYAGEMIGAIQTVASLTMEAKVLDEYGRTLALSRRDAFKAALQASAVLALARAGVVACMALGFWYGGMLIVDGEYSLLAFIVVYSSIITSAYSAGIVFSFTPDLAKAQRSAAGLQRLLERRSAIDPESADGESIEKPPLGRVDFRDVSFAYPGQARHPALSHVSLTVPAGATIALVGHTGSGKSTIVSLLQRFYDPTQGSIFLDGRPIASLNVAEYRSLIGLVSQEPTLLQGSIRMNLVAGCRRTDITDAEIEEACRKANILDFVSSLPNGFNTVVGSRGSQLSGGQKQRLAIARALVRKPALLVLDEATSAIDSTSELLIQEALAEAAAGCTTIVIAHRLSTIQNAHVIYVVEKGRIVEYGTHSQLVQKRDRYYKLFATGLAN
ncbi:Multidrug resistance protein sirA [Colletotrichum trifolii]|uniref:Multidrug resistance protein sirA n=1 Tax=Colletotrichum trifolii TaxID=5466 RepID=A0A4R8QMJ0_COLTR|nr:Multidrug resistance protein sirA [Colletotrichum trifolii]